ncbi:MAG: ABC transporter substrate-binding protein [Gemmatimonadales bacterium]
MRRPSPYVWTVLAVVCVSCRAPEARSARAAVSVVDDLGRAVTLAAPARRIVSLVPATTELLFAIGAGSAVVGRTDWCDYPAAALEVPSVGDGIGPNLELVVGRRPDLVLLYASADRGSVAGHLGRLGIPAMSLSTDQLADVARLARLLGRVTGRERSADSLAEAFEKGLADAAAPEGRARSAFLLVWDQPPMTVGRGSFLTELMARAGLRNIFDDVGASSAVISIEGVVARDPDLILTLGTASPKVAGRPEWEAVPAVRDRRFVHAEGSEFSHPGPRSPQAIRELRQAVEAATSR